MCQLSLVNWLTRTLRASINQCTSIGSNFGDSNYHNRPLNTWHPKSIIESCLTGLSRGTGGDVEYLQNQKSMIISTLLASTALASLAPKLHKSSNRSILLQCHSSTLDSRYCYCSKYQVALNANPWSCPRRCINKSIDPSLPFRRDLSLITTAQKRTH